MKKTLGMISPFNSQEDMPLIFFILKKLFAFVFIFFISMIVAESLAIIIHYIMGYNILQGDMLSTQAMTLMKYYGYAVFIIVAVLYCKIIEKRPIKSMGFNSKFIGSIHRSYSIDREYFI